MARRAALFRCDASAEIGGGHVSRCLALAFALRERGWTCRFAAASGSSAIVPSLATSDFAVLDLPASPPAEQAGRIGVWLGEPVDLSVVDHYGLDAAFGRLARAWSRTVLVIDELVDRALEADLLLDQTPGRSTDAYRGLAPPACRLLLGPAFALLRPSFADMRGRALAGRGRPVSRVFICMGASDPHGLTMMAVEAVSAWNPGFAVDVVVGAAHPGTESLRRAVEACGPGSRLHVATPHVADLMAEADLAVGSAGVIAWERCTLGLPCCLVVTADNQRANADALERAGAVSCAGDFRTATLERIVARLAEMTAGDRLRSMSDRAAALCDGQGRARVADAIEEIVS